MTTKRTRSANRLVWVSFLMFAASVFCQGFHSDWGFRIAGGVGLVFGFVGLIFALDWDDDNINPFRRKSE